jgi:pyridoxal phosphate enzyme (YggS family)
LRTQRERKCALPPTTNACGFSRAISMAGTIAEMIGLIRERIAVAAGRAGRDPAEVRLIGVTKTHPPETVAQALVAGLADVGENRVQEAEAKIEALAAERQRLTWHLIGHLQTNKAKKAAALFDWVHSVDSLRVARVLSRERVALDRPPLSVLLQINVSGEASKEGFDLNSWERRPPALDAFVAEAEQLVALPGLRVCGLMMIAPFGDEPEAARPHFASTRQLRDILASRLGQTDWSQLSMGMTDDFPVAIEEGATIVRIGRAIFGAR